MVSGSIFLNGVCVDDMEDTYVTDGSFEREFVRIWEVKHLCTL